MATIVGIRFKRAGKVYYFDPKGFENLDTGDWVVVKTSQGIEAGRVVISPRQVVDEEIKTALKPIYRRADWRDLTEMQHLKLKAPEALATARAKAKEHGLQMRPISAEYNFDGSRLTIYFTADQRIDFRHLVRDLTKTLKTRIELRQVGARDDAKLLDGIGKCGLDQCCSTWLTNGFPRVSIKAAKNQGLPLAPPEISGNCGKLLCCLTYEDDQYTEIKGELPAVGTKLTSSKGTGEVVGINVVKEVAIVQWENGTLLEVSAEAFRELAERRESRGAREQG
ncbi:MAG: stage 0 sporulation family protein [Anaerolineae bacterium]